MKRRVGNKKENVNVGQELRNLGALIEDNNHKIGAIGEQYQGINKQLDSHDLQFDRINQKLDSHDLQFDRINQKLDSHDLQFDRINQKLDSHEEMIGKLVEDVEIVKTNVEFMKNALKRKVDYDEFTPLERRVHVLEGKAK
jgi:peptidoglycan hydrolase CwlO-like protein